MTPTDGAGLIRNAIFYDGQLVFLSHIHPRFPSRYDAQLPEVAWRRVADGVELERADGVRFGAASEEGPKQRRPSGSGSRTTPRRPCAS